jgi:hypothetical protein
MKYELARAFAVAILSVEVGGCLNFAEGATAAPIKGVSATFPVAEVIAEVKRELAAAQNTQGADVDLSLTQVELNFSLTSTTDENGKVSVGIPIASASVGGNGERRVEQTSSLMVELAPPKPSGTMSADESKDLGITQAIIQARDQLKQGLNEVPKLTPNKVVITLKFAVTKTKGANGQVKFLIFSIGGGQTTSDAASNSIALTFAKAKGP